MFDPRIYELHDSPDRVIGPGRSLVRVYLLQYRPSALSLAAAHRLLGPGDGMVLATTPGPRLLSRILARGLLRRALAERFGVPPATFAFAPTRSGKPALAGGARADEVSFSVSHTDGLVACAVGDGGWSLGVDCERRGRAMDFAGLAVDHFCPSEAAFVAARPAGRERRFLELWTLKEAHAKARGLGLSLGLDATAFRVGRQVQVSFPAGHDSPERWHCLRPIITRRHVLAAAVAGAGPAVTWDLRPLRPGPAGGWATANKLDNAPGGRS